MGPWQWHRDTVSNVANSHNNPTLGRCLQRHTNMEDIVCGHPQNLKNIQVKQVWSFHVDNYVHRWLRQNIWEQQPLHESRPSRVALTSFQGWSHSAKRRMRGTPRLAWSHQLLFYLKVANVAYPQIKGNSCLYVWGFSVIVRRWIFKSILYRQPVAAWWHCG